MRSPDALWKMMSTVACEFSSQATESRGNVLVVDDDTMIRAACARALAGDGWTVTSAGTTIESLEMLPNIDFDCVLSDIRMPGLDGFHLAANVHAHDEDIAILLMTGDPTIESAVHALDEGVVSYMVKPFSSTSLRAAVDRAARRRGVARARRRAESRARTLDASGDLACRFDNALALLWMAFQPIVDPDKVFAYEALVRTDEPSLQRPDLLIAAAERLGRTHDLGRAIRAAVASRAESVPADALLFVNLHPLDLEDDELYDPAAPLSQISARVVLEVTERVPLDDVTGPHRIARLRQLGYRIAIDDLGAGYATLGTLAMFEPEVVKLDMSLIRGIERHATKRQVVKAISALCRDLGSIVIAEGVETTAERETVGGLGIDLIQGYLIARPARELWIPVSLPCESARPASLVPSPQMARG